MLTSFACWHPYFCYNCAHHPPTSQKNMPSLSPQDVYNLKGQLVKHFTQSLCCLFLLLKTKLKFLPCVIANLDTTLFIWKSQTYFPLKCWEVCVLVHNQSPNPYSPPTYIFFFTISWSANFFITLFIITYTLRPTIW